MRCDTAGVVCVALACEPFLCFNPSKYHFARHMLRVGATDEMLSAQATLVTKEKFVCKPAVYPTCMVQNLALGILASAVGSRTLLVQPQDSQ